MHHRKIKTVVCLLCCCVSVSLGCGAEEKEKEIRFIEAVEDFIQISTDELNFSRSNRALNVKVSNNNNETARWAASTDAPWITVKPERGTIPPWGEISILIQINRGLIRKSEGFGFVEIDIPAYGEKKNIRVKAQT